MALLALIAGTVSYLHMRLLVESHGQPGWVAALTPLSVDGMIVAASTTLLADSRSGGRGGALPWALLAAGSVASLAAYVAVAEPTATGRVIAAWPSFALIAAYELLMRQVRRSAVVSGNARVSKSGPQSSRQEAADGTVQGPRQRPARPAPQREGRGVQGGASRDLQSLAWEWALANRAGDGSLPSGARSPASMAGTSGGAAWSSVRVLRVSSLLVANLTIHARAWSGIDCHRPRENDRSAHIE